MRKLNAARIGVLLLCILLTLPMLTGCANELLEQEQNEQELLEQIEDKWEAIIKNENDYVEKIEIASYVSQSMHSSTAIIAQDVILDESNKIDKLLSVFAGSEIVYEPVSGDLEQYVSNVNSRAGMETIKISFLENDGQRILRLVLYEDNSGSMYKPAVISAGHEVWQEVYKVSFSEQLFDLLKSIYDMEVEENHDYEENN